MLPIVQKYLRMVRESGMHPWRNAPSPQLQKATCSQLSSTSASSTATATCQISTSDPWGIANPAHSMYSRKAPRPRIGLSVSTKPGRNRGIRSWRWDIGRYGQGGVAMPKGEWLSLPDGRRLVSPKQEWIKLVRDPASQ